MESSSQIQTLSSKPGILGRLDAFDKRLSLKVHAVGLGIPRSILHVLEYSGDGRFCIPVPSAIWLAPVLFKFQELRSFLLNLFAAFMFDLIFIGVTKGIIRRPRPVYNKGMYVFVSVDHWSFPSGHASRALLVTTLFWFYEPMWATLSSEHFIPTVKPYLDQLYPGSGLLLLGVKDFVAPATLCLITIWAVATASSRVFLGRHYVMDVMVGCALGVAQAYFLHHVLQIPMRVSQPIHAWLLAKFGIASL